MSLLSLRKSTPQAEPDRASVDSFIDDALLYASGVSRFEQSGEQLITVCDDGAGHAANDAMRRATFTLNQSTVDTLSRLSVQTGISRSRIIRIWAMQQASRDNENLISAITV